MPSFTRLRTHRRLPRLVALLVVCSWAVAPASAQDVTEVTLKGAFLFNFVRFATWPADALPASPTLSACIVGDHAVGDAFTRVVAGRPLDGRTIVVSILDPGVALPTCHLLYVSGLARAQVATMIGAYRDAAVLTVSDLEGFAGMGGMVEVFVETGKMKFRINPGSAKRSRVQISSRLLVLAQIVQDGPHPEPAGGAARTFSRARPNKSLFRMLLVPGIEWTARDTSRWERH